MGFAPQGDRIQLRSMNPMTIVLPPRDLGPAFPVPKDAANRGEAARFPSENPLTL